MFKNIIFVGGIHGVGKSTLCIPEAQILGIEYLSASEVLRWKKISTSVENKNVENVSFTQDRLVTGLKNIIAENKTYILDGHFCLFDASGIVTRIPESTFVQMNPAAFLVVVNDPKVIATRLQQRDNRQYIDSNLAEMQQEEIEYAKILSAKLSIPIHIHPADNRSDIHEILLTYIQ